MSFSSLKKGVGLVAAFVVVPSSEEIEVTLSFERVVGPCSSDFVLLGCVTRVNSDVTGCMLYSTEPE